MSPDQLDAWFSEMLRLLQTGSISKQAFQGVVDARDEIRRQWRQVGKQRAANRYTDQSGDPDGGRSRGERAQVPIGISDLVDEANSLAAEWTPWACGELCPDSLGVIALFLAGRLEYRVRMVAGPNYNHVWDVPKFAEFAEVLLGTKEYRDAVQAFVERVKNRVREQMHHGNWPSRPFEGRASAPENPST